MEQWGNLSSYNLENVLRQNILNSEYYRDTCVKLGSWSEVVDEIYETVVDVEPWMSGNARGASTAFCLLYRLFTLKPTVQEINETITHRDSPYIRAVGFLYLRYVCDPKNLWSWCSKFVSDSEDFTPSPNGKTVTMGDYVRDLLLEQYYFETIFPRIPKKAQDEIIQQLQNWGLPSTGKGNGGAGGPDRRGSDEPNRRPPSVKASLSVAFGQRAPNRAGAREEGRGRDPSLATRDAPGSSKPRSDTYERPRPSRSPEPYRGRDGARDARDPERDYGRDKREGGRGDGRMNGGRGRGDYRDGGSRGEYREGGERGRGDYRDTGGRGDYREGGERGRGDYRDTGGRGDYREGGERGRGEYREGGGRGRGDYRDGREFDRNGAAGFRSRSRSAERNRDSRRGGGVSPVRPTRDVFKDKASGHGPDNELLRDRYGADRR